MLTNTLYKLFERDLNRLVKEIKSYSREENMWLLSEKVNNCTGNLALHMVGNLRHFIGATLGNTGYIRRRSLEFSTKDVPRDQLVTDLEDTKELVVKVILNLTEEQLEENYPIDVFGSGEPMKTSYFLTHLYGHLNYHLGQVSYHRRILDK